MLLDKQKEVVLVLQDTTYENPLPARDISELMNINVSETCSSVRKLIFGAVKNLKVPIGSCQRGYFIIRNGHEMQRYLNSLLIRQIGITERIDATYRAGASFMGKETL